MIRLMSLLDDFCAHAVCASREIKIVAIAGSQPSPSLTARRELERHECTSDAFEVATVSM